MPLQYLSDYSGKHTAVVIPIGEWENIVNKHADLRSLEQPEPTSHPSGKHTMAEFAGSISKEMAEQLQKHVEQSRNEWDSRAF
jgi:hypothetical protein